MRRRAQRQTGPQVGQQRAPHEGAGQQTEEHCSEGPRSGRRSDVTGRGVRLGALVAQRQRQQGERHQQHDCAQRAAEPCREVHEARLEGTIALASPA